MRSKRIIAALLSLLAGCAMAAFCALGIVERFELGVLNYWFQLRGPRPAPNDIVLVAMDELSYRDLNVPLNQPWPRKLHAQLIERLAAMGAKRVVFDVLFLDAGVDPAADKALAQAISKVPVYLGIESAVQRVAGGSGSYAIEEILEPYEPFSKAAAGVGLVSLPLDEGVVRRFLVDRSEQTSNFPTLAEAGAGFSPGDSSPRPHARDLINFLGPARSISTLSYYQILEQDRPLPASAIKDKIVYVGITLRTDTGPAQKDIFETSYGGGRIFGTEIHATAAANLMRGDWIRRYSWAFEAALQVVAAIALSFAIICVSPTIGAVIVGICLIGWVIIAFLLFTSGLFIPGGLLVAVLLPAIYLFSTLYYYFVARRSAQTIQSAFELYLSPEMAQQLSQGGGAATLGGAKLWASALFTDIESFTNITEEMPAERVAAMLNAYFTEVMEVVFQNKGTLIKFIGDAVFVLWGAPVRIDNHAELAVRTALAIDQEVARFNSSGRFPALKTRIGINTGPMVVGNLGSKRRFDYTAIGDSVNLASRIEGLNKYLGTTVLFSESTRKDCGSSVPAIRIADVQVFGKKETVTLYTIFEPMPSAEVSSELESGLSLFKRRNWSEARARFTNLATLEPRLAKLCDLYIATITEFTATPPQDGWNGQIEFGHK